jgi:tetratricopeptide (TPR) repeat protein
MKPILAVCAALAAVSAGLAADPYAPLAVTSQTGTVPSVLPTDGNPVLSGKYLQAGLSDLSKGLPGPAVQAFNDSVRLCPTSENYRALGTALFEVGDEPKAKWAFEQAQLLKPDPKIQAVIQALDASGKGGVELGKGTVGYQDLLTSAGVKAAGGDTQGALKDYLAAFKAQPVPENAKACLRLAAGILDADIADKNMKKAAEDLRAIQGPLGSAGLGPEGAELVSRIDKSAGAVQRFDEGAPTGVIVGPGAEPQRPESLSPQDR